MGSLGQYRYKRELHPFFDLLLPLLSAHRGASGIRPEATEIAYRTALEQNADILEADVHLSADGVPVLTHDPYVDRITDRSGFISGYTLAELKGMDAGYWFTPDDGDTYPYRGQGHTILSLREGFEKFPGARFTIDIKDNRQELVDKVFSLVEEFDRANLTLLTSFSAETMRMVYDRIRATGIKVATAASEPEVLQCVITEKLGLMIPPENVMSLFVPPTGGMGLGYRFPAVITHSFNAQAHALNIPVVTWTVDKGGEAEMLLATGVGGIVTNFPARMFPYIRGERFSRSTPVPASLKSPG